MDDSVTSPASTVSLYIDLAKCTPDKFALLVRCYLDEQGVVDLEKLEELFCYGGLVHYQSWNRQPRSKLIVATTLRNADDEEALLTFINDPRPLAEKIIYKLPVSLANKIQQVRQSIEVIVFHVRENFNLPDNVSSQFRLLAPDTFKQWVISNKQASNMFDSAIVMLEESLLEQKQLVIELTAKRRDSEIYFAAYQSEQQRRVVNERKAVWEDITLTMRHKLINHMGPLFYAFNQLCSSVEGNKKNKKLLEMIHLGLTGSKEIIDSLKSVSEAKGIKVEELPLDALLKTLQVHINPLMKKGEEFIYSTQINNENLYKVSVDQNKFKQILDELIANARYWVNTLNKNMEIIIGTKVIRNKSSFYLQIGFRDNGPGIAKENKEKVFWAYNTYRPDKSGSGLGLHIVDDIVQLHGGEIVEQGELGEGAHFLINLPVTLVRE